MDVKEMGRLGGLARAAKLSPEQRRKIAAKGGRAGKGKAKPRRVKSAELAQGGSYVP